MRSVPHKVICLLGMDDQAFPRSRSVDGDDLLAARPQVGDRDPRSEDRQLFLDAIMAAEQTLVVVYTGHDPRTNALRPPAIPVGELLDAVESVATTADGAAVRDQLVVEHPLQPYDPRNFSPAARVRSFDGTALAAARVAIDGRTPAPPVFTRAIVPLAADGGPAGATSLADLQRFFKHPAKAYARDRAGWIPPGDDDAPDDVIPLSVEGLAKWQIGNRLLAARLDGVSTDDLVAAEWRRGTLPPRALGSTTLDAVLRDVDQIHARALRWRDQPRREIDLSAEGDGWAVSGTTTRVYGQRIVSVGFSWANAGQWQEVWWELLALACTQPEIPWQAVALGKGPQVAVLGPVGESFARQVLGDAVELRATGLTAPLPLPAKAAVSYVQQVHRGRSIEQALDKAGAGWKHENDELWTRFWGPQFSDLVAEPAVPGEQRGPDADPSRFGTLARRAYLPLLLRSEGIR